MSRTDLESTKIHLCDNCQKAVHFPACLPDDMDDVDFGNANGLDNVIKCTEYESII